MRKHGGLSRDVVFNEVSFNINNLGQQATIDLDSEAEPEQNTSISEDAQ